MLLLKWPLVGQNSYVSPLSSVKSIADRSLKLLGTNLRNSNSLPGFQSVKEPNAQRLLGYKEKLVIRENRFL
ncbi:conserved hypothetical protein [Roseibium sp. TrichSKD4]|nr:conserved hypothetical protein [Roseibium sp. TrichSKD4]